ncbi:MAG TPA: DUF1800 domain-containing protein [Nocardioidaceae bacterium]|nr:DUF1800 domain-containing protein [Nocardioidaceae bacterium]
MFVPTPAQRHLLSRFSYGVTPGLVGEMRRAGGAEAWFNRQLRPGRIRDRQAAAMRAWFPYLDRTPSQLWQTALSGKRAGWEIMNDFARWTLLRRIYSRRQVHEVMTEFWSNLLHVPAPGDSSWPHRISYDATIRKHALGRFEDLLYAAITHPAMGCYLDNATSRKDNPNENLGRELLELHTVGRQGGYTEKDVRNSARILTGWKVDIRGTWRAYYDEDDHDRDPVRVMEFYDENRDRDGRPLTRRYLTYLARHEATAKRLAKRLAVQFVSDDPPADLVNDVARAYLRNKTSIPATLRALVGHPAFRRAAGEKVRTPTQDLAATYRVLGVRALRPQGGKNDMALEIIWQAGAMGDRPFHWATPDGPPLVNDAWTSVSRMLGSWTNHLNIAGGFWPKTRMRRRPALAWMPELPARFDFVVDHLCRQIHARPASDAMIDAACLATGARRRERITGKHRIVGWQLPWLLQSLLDTPEHMTR